MLGKRDGHLGEKRMASKSIRAYREQRRWQGIERKHQRLIAQGYAHGKITGKPAKGEE